MPERIDRHDLYRLVHDLKTPLNTVTGRLQMALKRLEEPLERRYILQAISGARTVLRKFYNLHDLVALEQDPQYPPKGTSGLSAAWAAVLKAWGPLAAALGLTIAGEVPAGFVVAADGQVLERMLDNLLSNALLHPGEPGLVSVLVEQAGASVRLSLRNDCGKNVPESPAGNQPLEVPIQMPDFSGGLTINRLGLAAVKALAKRLGGEFDARRTASVFLAVLTLPRAN